MDENIPIADAPNLGPASGRMRERAGNTTFGQLPRVGSVAAFAAVKEAGGSVSVNLLWALAAAVSDLTWQEVARIYRTGLLLALHDHQRRRREGNPAR
ncbi:MAG: TfoX/Sxy family DNA transformation protein [Microbacteriaceae bacterium]|nr:TfoX/Sxy family DNA transformation protein [Burkholderiaceae bacterium]